ncbi:MAG: sugar transferase [Terriglobia bacterium]
MFARRLRAVSVAFATVDVAVAVLAFVGAYAVRSFLLPLLASRFPFLPALPLYPFSRYLPVLGAIVGVWLVVGYFLGVYRPRELRERRQAVAEPTKQVVAGALVMAAGLFFAKGFYVSRILLLGFLLLDWILQVGVRLAFIEWWPRLRGIFGDGHYVLVVGTGPSAQELAGLIRKGQGAGLALVGFVETGGGKDPPTSTAVPREPVWPVAEVPRILRERVVDEVVFAVSKEELESLEELLLLCEEEGVRTRVQLKVFPHLYSRVYVEHLYHVPLLTFTTTPENELHLLAKRLTDVVGSALLLLAASPFLVLLAVLVKLTSPGPILYRQQRCGLGGRRFTLYKFRSMVAGADERREELAALNQADGPVFKIKNDPRCTPLGRWMRKFSLDELPQLWNVFKGDMSLVGPRPPLPEEVARYERWHRRRLRMRPGLTCLWALEGRSQLSFVRWMQLDLDYIDSWSLWLDLKIFLKTIPRVLGGRGAA